MLRDRRIRAVPDDIWALFHWQAAARGMTQGQWFAIIVKEHPQPVAPPQPEKVK